MSVFKLFFTANWCRLGYQSTIARTECKFYANTGNIKLSWWISTLQCKWGLGTGDSPVNYVFFHCFNLVLAIHRQNEAQEGFTGINTWQLSTMVTNASGNGAPAVSRSNSAGWCEFGREKHVEKMTAFLQKVQKTWNFGQNMDFLEHWRLFWWH